MGSQHDAPRLTPSLVDALIRLARGELGFRLPRNMQRDEEDTAAFVFNAVAAELERLLQSVVEQDKRINAAVEQISKVLVATAGGDFGARVERNDSGDAVDVLAYLVNSTVNELGLFVAEREQRAERLLAEKESLANRDRLAVLGQLTASVSHELRNPLTALAMSAKQLEVTLPHDARVSKVLQRMERSIARCTQLVEELLDFTRVTHISRLPVSLDAWVREVGAELRVPPGITLSLNLASDGDSLALDEDRFRRVLVNLVENASQAIAASREPTQGQISISTRRDGDEIEIAVTDSGPGFPPNLREKVFEPLFSTKSFGVGLGLTIVKQIVELHQGRVVLGDAPGGGGQVQLRFSRSQGV